MYNVNVMCNNGVTICEIQYKPNRPETIQDLTQHIYFIYITTQSNKHSKNVH